MVGNHLGSMFICSPGFFSLLYGNTLTETRKQLPVNCLILREMQHTRIKILMSDKIPVMKLWMQPKYTSVLIIDDKIVRRQTVCKMWNQKCKNIAFWCDSCIQNPILQFFKS